MRRFKLVLIGLLPIVLMGQEFLILQPDGTDGKDAMIWAAPNFGTNDNNYGSSDQLVLNAWTNSTVPDTIRALVEFDLSSVPVGSSITYALLSFYNNASGASHNGQHQNLDGTNEWEINRAIESWDEDEVTWENKPAYSSAGQILMSASSSPDQDYIDTDVTDMVQDMVDHPELNFGFYLKLQNETPYKALVFASSEHETPEIRPRLILQYTLPVGLEEFNLSESRKLIRITDMLGREIPYAPGIPLILQFDDGTTEQRVIIEN
ncbi:MAG: DNRLRE domain-containing protein [Flavobacteriales bacterium]|nr:DNRLRE domain-containing protein [Flavobacteriales bacterium]